MAEVGGAAGLGRLRAEIDRIDAAMHELLIERGELLRGILAAKGPDGDGSVLRPEREAAMLRALVARHRGPYPVDAVVAIWRLIMSASSFVQRPFALHLAGADAALRDAARFHFGFMPSVRVHDSAEAVVEAVADGTGDLGIVALGGRSGATPWWERLTEESAPKIVARLPFVGLGPGVADCAALVLARTRELRGASMLYAGRSDRPFADSPALERLGSCQVDGADAVLLSVPSGTEPPPLRDAVAAGTFLPVGHHQDPVRSSGA